MNEQIEQFARKTLLLGLNKCTEGQQMIFKRMYSHENINKPIDEVVNDMHTDKLDGAMSQVQRSLDKNNA